MFEWTLPSDRRPIRWSVRPSPATAVDDLLPGVGRPDRTGLDGIVDRLAPWSKMRPAPSDVVADFGVAHVGIGRSPTAVPCALSVRHVSAASRSSCRRCSPGRLRRTRRLDPRRHRPSRRARADGRDPTDVRCSWCSRFSRIGDRHGPRSAGDDRQSTGRARAVRRGSVGGQPQQPAERTGAAGHDGVDELVGVAVLDVPLPAIAVGRVRPGLVFSARSSSRSRRRRWYRARSRRVALRRRRLRPRWSVSTPRWLIEPAGRRLRTTHQLNGRFSIAKSA